MHFFKVYSETPFMMPTGGPIEKTEAEIAFYILSRVAGEGKDRSRGAGDYTLTEEERKQLSDICEKYAHVVVAVNTGGLVDLSFMDEFSNIEALLYMVQPGMEGGSAFTDIVCGDVTPSGKLSDSWTYRYEDYPNSETFSGNSGDVEQEFYSEGIYVGYRYFDSFDIPVRYGFGYGLSYTDFTTEFVSGRWDAGKKKFVLTAKVKNCGATYSGREVVQLYVTAPVERLEKEYRRLAGFGKTALLAPGESEEVVMEVSPEELSSYEEEKVGWMLEKGDYIFWMGNSLESSVPVFRAKLEKDVMLTKNKNIAPLQKELTQLKQPDEKMREKREKLARSGGQKSGIGRIALRCAVQ